ncbi:MAG: cystathionine beta-synthase [Candidatus Promineifilaceae bacterium]
MTTPYAAGDVTGTIIYDTILDTIGDTPLVRLNSVTAGLECTVLAKIESFNPGGSVKDRIGRTIIEDAEQRGLLKPGGTIVEATSGNTGVGLAIAAAIKGYRCIFVMPDKMSQEKIMLLRAYGARVVVTPTAVEPDDPRSYYSVARRIVEETPSAFLANQYHNPVNPATHYEFTGPELWRQTAGRITHFVAGVGTGGTISGTGHYLKEKNPAIQIVGVDPVGSVLYELHRSGKMTHADSYKVEGIGEDFLPGTTDLSVIDTMVQVTDRQSFLMSRRLVREEGIFVGGSCGSAVAGAIKYAETHRLGREDMMVVVLPDSGYRYLSKVYNDDWMRENGFLERSWVDVRAIDVQLAKGESQIYTAHLNDPINEVIARLKQHNISQLPVVDENGSLIGIVSEVDLLNHILLTNHDHHAEDETIEALIDKTVPQLNPATNLETVMAYFTNHTAVTIVSAGEILGILTKIDILDFLTRQVYAQ